MNQVFTLFSLIITYAEYYIHLTSVVIYMVICILTFYANVLYYSIVLQYIVHYSVLYHIVYDVVMSGHDKWTCAGCVRRRN